MSESETMECCICQNSSNEDEEFVTLPCNHSFHKSCVGRAFNYNQRFNTTPKCPICRTEVTTAFLIQNGFLQTDENNRFQLDSRFELTPEGPQEEIPAEIRAMVDNLIDGMRNPIVIGQSGSYGPGRLSDLGIAGHCMCRECMALRNKKSWFSVAFEKLDRMFNSPFHRSIFFIGAWVYMGLGIKNYLGY